MKHQKLKEVWSYISPVLVENCPGNFNRMLEVTLSGGKYLLNSEKSNYSFGSLHTIFQNTFSKIDIANKNLSNALILGLGAGSVMHLLRYKHKLSFPVTGIEIDPVVIDLGNKYFYLDQYKDLSILNMNAFDYVKETDQVFDLIIVDVYINDEVPEIFHSTEFVTHLKRISRSNTLILFNKMLNTIKATNECAALVNEMTKAFGKVDFLAHYVNGVENRMLCVNTERAEDKERQDAHNPLRLWLPKPAYN